MSGAAGAIPTRVRCWFAAAVVALIGALALQTGVGASPLTESPATANLDIVVTGGAAATDGRAAGDVVGFHIESSGGVTLSAVETRLCKTGFTSYTTTTFGTSGSSGTRCVQEFGTTPFGIISPNFLTPNPGTTYRIDQLSLAPGSTSSPNQNFTVGTGHVEWLPAGGVPQSMDCDSTHPCDMVVKVDHSAGTTFFIQTITFAGAGTTTTTGGGATTTTTPATTAPTTTTTAPPTTTTTTAPTTTTTTAPATTTTTSSSASSSTTTTVGGFSSGTTLPVSGNTVPVVVGSGGTGSTLAFTGASTRDLASAGLLMLALGLLVIGEHERRRSRR